MTQRLGRPMALELRPDKSKVVIGTTNQGEELVFYVSPDRPDAWNRGGFRQLVAEIRSRGKVMHVSLGDDLRRIFEPVIALAHHTGLSRREIGEAQQLVQEHEDDIRSAWHRHFGS